MSDFERRSGPECRIESDESGKIIRGYAIRFDTESLDLGGFTEIIAPEAVDRTLREALDVRALVDHDSAKVIGRTRAGTLELRKDARGLAIRIEPDPGISYAGDVLKSVARGDISGMSFAFRAIADEWDWETDPPRRTVTDMTIREVSIVSFPAYPSTDVSVAVRSLLEGRRPVRSVAWLRRWHKTRLAR